MERFLRGGTRDCPFYRPGDDYRTARRAVSTTNHDKTAPWTDTMSKAIVCIYTMAHWAESPVYVFLQAQVKLRHLPGGFPAHIAVVPGLIDNACDLAFGVGIAQDKTVFPAVLDQPLLDQGVLLPLVQNLIGGVYDVQGQARLVLTGARHRLPQFQPP